MSDKVRVYEVAEEAGTSSAEVITKAKDLGLELKSPQSAISYEDAEEVTKYIMTGRSSSLIKNTERNKKLKKDNLNSSPIQKKILINKNKRRKDITGLKIVNKRNENKNDFERDIAIVNKNLNLNEEKSIIEKRIEKSKLIKKEILDKTIEYLTKIN